MIDIDVKRLIPQREPIMMVDRLLYVDGDEAVTCLTVRQGNPFLADDGTMEESGLIEHIAQSASALAGYKTMENGAPEPLLGYIGEVKKFRCHRRPEVGDELHTRITFGAKLGGVTLLTGEVSVCNELIADTQMKIFMQAD